MVTTHTLRAGDKLKVSGEITVIKCGMHSQCGGPAVPTATVEVDDGQEETPDSGEGQDQSQSQQNDGQEDTPGDTTESQGSNPDLGTTPS